MAKENITKFFDAAMTDKALAAKVAALATENGYDFTADELLELGAARPLSDSEVENAVGSAKNPLMGYVCKKCGMCWTEYSFSSKCPRCDTDPGRGFRYS